MIFGSFIQFFIIFHWFLAFFSPSFSRIMCDPSLRHRCLEPFWLLTSAQKCSTGNTLNRFKPFVDDVTMNIDLTARLQPTGPTAPTPERPYGRPQNVLTSSLVSFTRSSHKAKTSSKKCIKKRERSWKLQMSRWNRKRSEKMSESWVTTQTHFSTHCGSIKASLTFSPCHPAIEGRWTAVSLGHHH